MGIPLPLLSPLRGLAGEREKEDFFLGGGGSQVGSLGAGLSALQLQSDQGWVFPLVFTDTNSRVRS